MLLRCSKISIYTYFLAAVLCLMSTCLFAADSCSQTLQIRQQNATQEYNIAILPFTQELHSRGQFLVSEDDIVMLLLEQYRYFLFIDAPWRRATQEELVDKESFVTRVKTLTQKLQGLAEENVCPEPSYLLGCCYFFGFGVGKNEGEAYRYFLRAVDHGHDLAEYYCALIDYLRANRGSVDSSAVDIFRKLSNKGLAPAQACLALHLSQFTMTNVEQIDALWHQSSRRPFYHPTLLSVSGNIGVLARKGQLYADGFHEATSNIMQSQCKQVLSLLPGKKIPQAVRIELFKHGRLCYEWFKVTQLAEWLYLAVRLLERACFNRGTVFYDSFDGSAGYSATIHIAARIIDEIAHFYGTWCIPAEFHEVCQRVLAGEEQCKHLLAEQVAPQEKQDVVRPVQQEEDKSLVSIVSYEHVSVKYLLFYQRALRDFQSYLQTSNDELLRQVIRNLEKAIVENDELLVFDFTKHAIRLIYHLCEEMSAFKKGWICLRMLVFCNFFAQQYKYDAQTICDKVWLHDRQQEIVSLLLEARSRELKKYGTIDYSEVPLQNRRDVLAETYNLTDTFFALSPEAQYASARASVRKKNDITSLKKGICAMEYCVDQDDFRALEWMGNKLQGGYSAHGELLLKQNTAQARQYFERVLKLLDPQDPISIRVYKKLHGVLPEGALRAVSPQSCSDEVSSVAQEISSDSEVVGNAAQWGTEVEPLKNQKIADKIRYARYLLTGLGDEQFGRDLAAAQVFLEKLLQKPKKKGKKEKISKEQRVEAYFLLEATALEQNDLPAAFSYCYEAAKRESSDARMKVISYLQSDQSLLAHIPEKSRGVLCGWVADYLKTHPKAEEAGCGLVSLVATKPKKSKKKKGKKKAKVDEFALGITPQERGLAHYAAEEYDQAFELLSDELKYETILKRLEDVSQEEVDSLEMSKEEAKVSWVLACLYGSNTFKDVTKCRDYRLYAALGGNMAAMRSMAKETFKCKETKLARKLYQRLFDLGDLAIGHDLIKVIDAVEDDPAKKQYDTIEIYRQMYIRGNKDRQLQEEVGGCLLMYANNVANGGLLAQKLRPNAELLSRAVQHAASVFDVATSLGVQEGEYQKGLMYFRLSSHDSSLLPLSKEVFASLGDYRESYVFLGRAYYKMDQMAQAAEVLSKATIKFRTIVREASKSGRGLNMTPGIQKIYRESLSMYALLKITGKEGVRRNLAAARKAIETILLLNMRPDPSWYLWALLSVYDNKKITDKCCKRGIEDGLTESIPQQWTDGFPALSPLWLASEGGMKDELSTTYTTLVIRFLSIVKATKDKKKIHLFLEKLHSDICRLQVSAEDENALDLERARDLVERYMPNSQIKKLFDEAEHLFEQARYDEVLACLTKVYEVAKKKAGKDEICKIVCEYANALRKQELFMEALSFYELAAGWQYPYAMFATAMFMIDLRDLQASYLDQAIAYLLELPKDFQDRNCSLGAALFYKQQYAEALNLWKPTLEEISQRLKGMKISLSEGKVTCNRCMSNGEIEVCYLTSVLYLCGLGGVERDLFEAERHARNARVFEHADASFVLGLCRIYNPREVPEIYTNHFGRGLSERVKAMWEVLPCTAPLGLARAGCMPEGLTYAQLIECFCVAFCEIKQEVKKEILIATLYNELLDVTQEEEAAENAELVPDLHAAITFMQERYPHMFEDAQGAERKLLTVKCAVQ